MIHTKIQGHRPSGSGEEDLFRFLPYMDMAAILSWSCEQDHLSKHLFPHPIEAPNEI